MKQVLIFLTLLVTAVTGVKADDTPLIVSWNTAPTCTNDNTDLSTTGDANNLATWTDGTTVKIMRGDKGMSNGSNITVNGTSYKTIKVSNGAQNKLSMPSGKFAYAVDFYSYVNIKTADATGTYYWKEVNGTSYNTPTLTCYNDGDLTNPDKASFSLGGVSTFTFNNAGTQLCYVLFISTTPITSQPADATYGQDEVPSALTVGASSSAGTLTYQWYSCDDTNKTNSAAIGGATSASYSSFSTATVGTYYYYCVVTDNNGSFTSDLATITIVEASSLPTVTYSIGSAIDVSGIVPAAEQASSVTIPTNTMLYKTGYTLTGWTDGSDTYEAGDTYTPTDDVTLTAVFTVNTETLSEFRRDKTITWYFGKSNGATDYDGSAAANVQQVKIKNTTVDLGIKMAGGSNDGRNDEWMNNQEKNMTVPVVKNAVVKAKVYYTNDATINGEIIHYDESYGTIGNVVYTYTYTGDDPAEIAVNVGNQFLSYISVTYPGTGNAWDNFEDFSAIINNQSGTLLTAEEMAAQGNAVSFGVIDNNGVTERVAADDEDAIATISGKYHSDHGCTNVNVVVPVPGPVKIGVGQCTYSSSNIIVKDGNGTTVISKTPATVCWKNDHSNVTYQYYTGNPTTLTISNMAYCPFVSVAAAPLQTITGSINGGGIDGKNVIFTSDLTGQAFEAIVASNAFTLNVPADTYAVTLSDNDDYVISSPTSITVTAAAAVTINIVSATPQTVTGNIVNAPAEAFTLTFTGASQTETVNCAAGATSYTASLRPDTYTMSSNVGTLSPLSAENFTVVTSAVSHNIYFPETIPAATQQNITVDNTATVATNVYRTVSDALAAAKAGSISSPVITLTSGQTYREQVIVDIANVTFKTSSTEKAKITFYYGIGYSYYSLNADGYYDKDRAMTRNSILHVGPGRWGATVLVKSNGNNFKAENIIFENSFNQYYTTEEVTDGVVYNLIGDATITYDRTLTPGASGYKAADARDVTERAAAIAFENNPTGCQLYNCEFVGSQDTFYSSGTIYVKNCNIIGNTDYIFGGGNVVFDDCDLTIGGYSDKISTAYITANNSKADNSESYIFRDCTVKSYGRTYTAANLGRDWGGAKAHVYFFNLKNEIDDKLSYGWSNMGGGVTAGTADLHIYDFDPIVNANYASTGSSGANINGLLSDDDALDLYAGVVTRLNFTPEHIYDGNLELGEGSAYNKCRIAANDDVARTVELTRSITAGNWSTIVLPFDIASSNITTLFGEGASVAELKSGDATTLTFSTELTGNTMKANQPYAIRVASNFTSATISGVTIVEAEPTQSIDNWDFVGTYAADNIPAESYFFSGNQLWQAGDGTNTIAPFRAYFTYTGGGVGARDLNFIIDDETTGLADVRGKKEDVRGDYFNLNGQRVVQPTKGLYIVNGKKVIVK